MVYRPYTDMISNLYRAPLINSYIRVLHASPNTPPVDVYANEKLIVKDLTYKSFSQYIPVIPGNYNIKIYPTGNMTSPLINANVYIPENMVFNVAIIGNFPNISLYPIPEPTTAQNFGQSCIRFIHLSLNAPSIDITLSDGTKLFNNISYKDITNYACLPSGTYTFQGSSAGTSNILFDIPNVKLDANNYYTIYTVGLASGTPPLEAILVSEPRL